MALINFFNQVHYFQTCMVGYFVWLECYSSYQDFTILYIFCAQFLKDLDIRLTIYRRSEDRRVNVMSPSSITALSYPSHFYAIIIFYLSNDISSHLWFHRKYSQILFSYYFLPKNQNFLFRIKFLPLILSFSVFLLHFFCFRYIQFYWKYIFSILIKVMSVLNSIITIIFPLFTVIKIVKDFNS